MLERFDIYKHLVDQYGRWDGEDLSEFERLLDLYENEENFEPDLRKFKEYINRYGTMRTKTDSYLWGSVQYTHPTKQFNALNLLVTAYLPKRSLLSMAASVAASSINVARNTYNYIVKNPQKVVTEPAKYIWKNKSNVLVTMAVVTVSYFEYKNRTVTTLLQANFVTVPNRPYQWQNDEVIRMFTDGGPGSGNQVNTLNVYHTMRKAGYKKKVELIYPKDDKEKLANLLGIKIPTTEITDIPAENMQLISMDYYVNQTLQGKTNLVNLAITGGFFPPQCDVARIENVTVKQSRMCRMAANFAQAQVYVKIQPYYFGRESARTTTTFNFFNVSADQIQEKSGVKFIPVRVLEYSKVKEYLQDSPQGQAIVAAKPGLPAYIEAVDSGRYDFMAIYGKYFTSQYASFGTITEVREYHPYNIFIPNSIQLISAVSYVQSYLHHPLIIPVFYNYKTEMDVLYHGIQSGNWTADILGIANMTRTIDALNIRARFAVADIADPNSARMIQNLGTNQILMLSMGAFETDVFNALYRSSTWQVREGASSFNTLAITGRPHFRCGDFHSFIEERWEAGYGFIQGEELLERFKEFYKGFCSIFAWSRYPDNYIAMGQLLLEAYNTSSLFSRSFQVLREQALAPENNRIIYALDGANELLRNITRKN